MKRVLILLMLSTFMAASAQKDKQEIAQTLDAWHLAAAQAQFDQYFSFMAPEAIYIGTDSEENWTVPQFKQFAKPYFDKGSAWNFKPVQRNIYIKGDIAWFDELLDTWMKLCRGSGVMQKINGKWLITHYVLSMTIPNDNVNEVIKIISPLQDAALQKITN